MCRRRCVSVLLITCSFVVAHSLAQPQDINFSGYQWRVKDSGSQRWGPGPNHFSPDTRNVWVDSQGRLHVAITRRDGKWYCGEVISHRSFGFGRYEWRVGEISPPGELDANVVLGLFTWSDRPEYTHREIDVEVARWGQPNLKSNSQYVVQPWQPAGHVQRFTTPTVANVTHSFTWQPDRVDSMSTWVNSTTSQQENFTWSFVNGSASTFIVPQPFDENARMNLWLFRPNDGPLSNASVEIVLDSFSFTSLGASSSQHPPQGSTPPHFRVSTPPHVSTPYVGATPLEPSTTTSPAPCHTCKATSWVLPILKLVAWRVVSSLLNI